jgi:hypothetical protein
MMTAGSEQQTGEEKEKNITHSTFFNRPLITDLLKSAQRYILSMISPSKYDGIFTQKDG